MKIIKIRSKFNKLAELILAKNNEIISLIAVTAQLEAKYKKIIMESEKGKISKSELMDLNKRLNGIIRNNLTEK